MAPNSRRKSNFLKGLLPLLFTKLPFVGAQVAAIEKASNESLLWGPYRPNLYFGVRPRIPKSLMGGLLWTRVEDHTVQNSELLPMTSTPDQPCCEVAVALPC
jgi:mannosyl-oligosaccharide glucosidase